jgi:hypothetical protein
MTLNYEQDLRIDDASLDLEWLDQASLFMKYAKHLAETRKVLDEAKQELDIVKSEVDKSIREHPERFNIEKVTEGAIQSTILTHKDYQKAYQYMLDSKYEVDMASNAVQAMQIRKEALENMVKLHGQSYFAGPRVPHDLAKLREEKEKKTDRGIASKLSRTR